MCASICEIKVEVSIAVFISALLHNISFNSMWNDWFLLLIELSAQYNQCKHSILLFRMGTILKNLTQSTVNGSVITKIVCTFWRSSPKTFFYTLTLCVRCRFVGISLYRSWYSFFVLVSLTRCCYHMLLLLLLLLLFNGCQCLVQAEKSIYNFFCKHENSACFFSVSFILLLLLHFCGRICMFVLVNVSEWTLLLWFISFFLWNSIFSLFSFKIKVNGRIWTFLRSPSVTLQRNNK